MAATILVKLTHYHHEQMNGCTSFFVFNTVPFKQKLLQIVLWNKQEPLKKQGCNCFPLINTVPLQYSRSNHNSLDLKAHYYIF